MRSFAILTLQPWANRVQAAFQATVLAPQFRLRFDIGALTKADFESYSAALLRGRQGGCLSPNDCREEMGWPASSDPNADQLEPPVAGGRAPGDDDKPQQEPPSDEGDDKVALLHPRG